MTEKEIKLIDQNNVLSQFMKKGQGNFLQYIDNRKNIFGDDLSDIPWQDLLEMALDKAPQPRLRSIEAEIVRIADRKHDTRLESGKYLGIKRSTFGMKLNEADKETALTLVGA